jgi:hypothetical protein
MFDAMLGGIIFTVAIACEYGEDANQDGVIRVLAT